MFKNTHSAILVLTILVLASCKEKGPIIDLGKNNSKIGDTTYLTTAPQADLKTVLFEEFTGVSCSNCPNAKNKIQELTNLYPERAFSIAYHVENSGFTKIIDNLSKFDFRTPDATNVHDFLSRPEDAGLPKGGVNRYLYNNHYWLGAGDWSIMTDNVMKEEPTANITVTSKYDITKSEATINVRITYVTATNSKQALTVAITENGILDAQKNIFVIDTFYQHDHVLRDVITSHSGDPLLDDIATKELGRVYEKTFLTKVATDWKPENCHIVAFVHNNDVDSKEILQVAEVSLK